MGTGTGRLVLISAAFLIGVGLAFWLNRLPTAGGLDASAREGRSSQTVGTSGGGQQFRYRRVICMSPAVTEIVFALGAGDRVVGVSQHTKYPPQALGKVICGGFFNPNYELMLSLQPDLILTQGEAEGLRRFARDNGIRIVSLNLHDLESIFEQTKEAGRALEMPVEAELLCAEMRYRLARVRARVSRKPLVPVVLVTGHEPGTLNGITAVGPGTFLSDLIRVAGGRNVLGDLQPGYGIVSKEALLERAPEVVIELHGEGGDEAAKEREVRDLWQGLAPLPAVAQGRVYVLEATYAMIPGPRVVMLAERLAGIFHGEDG